MGTMNGLEDYFLKKYSDAGYLVNNKAKVLMYLDILAMSCCSAYALVQLFLLNFSEMALFFATASIVFLSLLQLKRGKFYFASNIMIIVVVSALSASAFMSNLVTIYQIYSIDVCLVFTLIFICMIGIKTYQFIMIIIFNLIAFSAFLITLIAHLSRQNIPYHFMPVISSLFILIISNICSIYLNRIINKAINNAEHEAKTNAENFNKLSNVIQVSKESITIGTNLINSTQNTTSTIKTMESDINIIKNEMSALNEKMQIYIDANNDIVMQVKNYKNEIEKQNSALTHTSETVEQISLALTSINSILQAKKSVISQLQDNSQKGLNEINTSLSAINNLSRQVEDISEIINVIAEISQQTNLLAMNANIEAAHAGESGKGFAVIANEIHKLSENTSEQTKKITETINTTISEINDSANHNKSSADLFILIDKEIKEVYNSLIDTFGSIGQVSSGTKEIINRVNEIVLSSENAQKSLSKIEELNNEFNSSIQNITTFINNLTNIINNFFTNFKKIGEETTIINTIGYQNVEQIKHLTEKINEIKN